MVRLMKFVATVKLEQERRKVSTMEGNMAIGT